jgi:N4-gp56 family major capsid protein
MFSLNLSSKLRTAVQPRSKFRQLCDAKDATMGGLKKGDIFTWDLYADVGRQGTTLLETNTMPETNYTVTQGTLQITEMGQAVPYSGKLDNLSMHPLTEIINKVLKNDVAKALDLQSWAQYNATPLRVYPTGGTSTTAVTLTTNGTAGGTSTTALRKGHIGAIRDLMVERNIPPYSGDDYFCLAWPSTLRTLMGDLESVHQYTTEGFGMIMAGEKGRYEQTRFIEQTNVPKAGWTSTDWAVFLGQDTVAEAIAVPEEMRGKIPTDYGRSKGVAWYYLGGFGLVQNVVLQSRVIKWDSLA